MVDRAKPCPTPLQNEFIPQEVLLSLTSAANAGSCPENLLPLKTKTPQVCIYMYKVLWKTAFWYPVHYLLSICYVIQSLLKRMFTLFSYIEI